METAMDTELKNIGIISYALHALVAIAALIPGAHASILLLLFAMILDLAKRGAARGTWQESHFDFRLRTVFIAGALYVLTAPLWLLFIVPGWCAWALVSFWFAYRIIKGFMQLLANAPVS